MNGEEPPVRQLFSLRVSWRNVLPAAAAPEGINPPSVFHD
ncbi:MAG: hypothetical protein QOH16_1373 [Gaiellaceae bacterium]|nr:hypothetical protein [Gaiellaceae bacterium]